LNVKKIANQIELKSHEKEIFFSICQLALLSICSKDINPENRQSTHLLANSIFNSTGQTEPGSC
jgi:hypothetical protein